MSHLIQTRFSGIAQKQPQAPMVVQGDRVLTYGQADAMTNRIARFLESIAVRPGHRVAFCQPKSPESFLALLGILKADAAYVPLDSKSPMERVFSILIRCECTVLFTDSETLKTLAPDLTSATGIKHVIVLDSDSSQDLNGMMDGVSVHGLDRIIEFPDTPREYRAISEDLAYIVFTSGSTGTPKGVMIPHRAVLDYADWTIEYFRVTPEDRLSSHAGLHFDLSVFDVYTALMSGASLYPVPRNASLFPKEFIKFAQEMSITIWCSVPSFLTYQAKSGILKNVRLDALRAVTFCGEVMPSATMIQWMEHFPNVEFVNQYGPSETTCASMFFPINEIPEDQFAAVPIGKAIPNTTVFALNEDNQPVATGERGELFIRGAGNGLGYWNDPDKTAAAFIQNPMHESFPDTVYATGDIVTMCEDGVYEFIERRDHQIKYMGHRIELGEIEFALNGHKAVHEAAVLGLNSQKADTVTITAFVSLSGEATVQELRSHLAELLPSYMVPKKIILMDELPHNRNGKIDRLTLADTEKS